MNYTPTFWLDLEPDLQSRPRNDWSYLSMAQQQAYIRRQNQQPSNNNQLDGLNPLSVPISAADELDLTQAMLEMSSPASMSSMSSMPPGLSYSAVTLDGPEPDPLGDLPAPTTFSSGNGTTAFPSSNKPSPFTNPSSSPSEQYGAAAGRQDTGSRHTSPGGKEKATSPEKDVQSSSSKSAQPQTLEFITASDPKQFKDKNTMKTVRSRVMTDYVRKQDANRRSSSTPSKSSNKRQAREKRERTSSGLGSTPSQSSATSAPDYSLISPPTSLPLLTLPIYSPLQFPQGTLIQSPSSQSTSSIDSEVSLTRKQLVHRRYQQALDVLLGQASPQTLKRDVLIDVATRYYFDHEQRQPTPLKNFLGAPLDAFRTMPQATSRKVNVSRLKFSCAKFFGTRAMGASWVPAMLHNRLAFLSTLCIAAAHEDAMRGLTIDSDETNAVKTEVTHLMIYEMQNVDDLEIMAILELLCGEIIRTGADETQLYMHSQSIMKFVKQRGGLEKLGLGGDLAKFLTTMTFNIAVFCELQPHTMYVNYIDSFRPPPPPPNHATIPESPLFCPRSEFFTLLDIQNDDLRNRRCKPHTYELLCEMRDLTNHFCIEGRKLQALDVKLQEVDVSTSSSAAQDEYLIEQDRTRRKFQQISTHATRYVSRLHSCTSSKAINSPESDDWFYESVRLCAVIYTHALSNHIPFSTASQILGTCLATENGRTVEVTYPRALMIALKNAGIDDCWQDCAGVLLWITLVGASAGRQKPPTTPSVEGGMEPPFSDPFSDPFGTEGLGDPFAYDLSHDFQNQMVPLPSRLPSGSGYAAATAAGGSSTVPRGSTASGSSTALTRSPGRDEELRRRAEARKWLVAVGIRVSVLLGFSHGAPLMGSLRKLIMVQGLLGWGGRRMSASPW